MAQTLLLDMTHEPVDLARLEKDPARVLRALIAQQSTGQASPEHIHRVIRTVMPRNDNALKRLLYYYLETVVNDKSLVVCMNQIAKDLHSPNEYVRGLVLRFVACIENGELLAHVLKDVVACVADKNAYVRLHAVTALATLAERFEMDAEAELLQALRRESNPAVLQALFSALDRLGIPVDAHYRAAAADGAVYTCEVLLAMVAGATCREFLRAMLRSEHTSVRFEAARRLLILVRTEGPADSVNSNLISNSEVSEAGGAKEGKPEHAGSSAAADAAADAEACMATLLAAVQDDRSFMDDFASVVEYFKGHAMALAALADAYNAPLAAQLIKKALAEAEIHECVRLAALLGGKQRACTLMTDAGSAFRALLLDGLSALVRSAHVVDTDVYDSCCAALQAGGSGADYQAALEYLRTAVAQVTPIRRVAATEAAVASLGRHSEESQLAAALGIVAAAGLEEQFDACLDRILADIAQCANALPSVENAACAPALFAESAPGTANLPVYLTPDFEIFPAALIAATVTRAFRQEWHCKAKALGMLLRLKQHGENTGLLDASGRAALTLCLRQLIKLGEAPQSTANAPEDSPSTADRLAGPALTAAPVLAPLRFTALSAFPPLPAFPWTTARSHGAATVQMSGLGDPLYVEASVSYGKYEIVLDVMLINQTEMYLQDIALEFIHSRHLAPSARAPQLALAAGAAATVQVAFSVRESASCFIAGTLSCRYPREGDYSASHVQHLGAVQIEINEFLEGAVVDFKTVWKGLEWENAYSITFKGTDLARVLEGLVRHCNGHVCDRLAGQGFLLGNIACRTARRALVLVNAVLVGGSTTRVELRLRASDEEVVKSVCELLSGYLREYISRD